MSKTETGNNKITPRMRESFSRLGEDLMCAYIANQSGAAFLTVKQRYGTEATGKKLGDYWIFAAGRMIGEMMEITGSGSKLSEELAVMTEEQRARVIKHTRPRKDTARR